MNAHTAASIVYGFAPTDSDKLTEARFALLQACSDGYRFTNRGVILATPACPDYMTALKLREEAAILLTQAEAAEGDDDHKLAGLLIDKANEIYAVIPPRWMPTSDADERRVELAFRC